MDLRRVVCTRSFFVGILLAYATVGLLAIALQDYVPFPLYMKASLFGSKSKTEQGRSAAKTVQRDVTVAVSGPAVITYSQEQMADLQEKETDTLERSREMDGIGLRKILKSGTHEKRLLDEDRTRFETTNGKNKIPSNVKCKENLTKQWGKLDCKKRLPHAIGIGVMKCGTGAVHQFLKMHPHVAFSKPKEIHYWTKYKNMSLDWYMTLMPFSSKYQITMEFTPFYLFGLDTPFLIKRFLPKTKFMVILRDPVVRAVSHYTHELISIENRGETVELYTSYKRKEPGKRAHLFLNGSFEKSVIGFDGELLKDNTLIDYGCYASHLQRWFDVFPREQFLIIDEGLFRRDTIPYLQEMERFLGLPPYFNEDKLFFDKERDMFCKAVPVRQCPPPERKGKPHPEVSEAVLTRLANFYRPHNERLNALLDVKFSWTL